MLLSERCKGEFPRADWQRGTQYARAGAVRITALRADGLTAKVKGSRRTPYDVEIDWSEALDDVVVVGCTCPRFFETGLCKHIAATLQEADKYSPHVPGLGRLYVEAVDDDPDEAGDEELREAIAMFSRFERDGSPAVGALAKPKKRIPAGPSWQDVVNRIAAASSIAKLPQRDHRVAPSQLWFVLDLAQTRGNGRVSLAVCLRALKKNGELGKLKSARVSLDEPAGVLSADDRGLLSMLVGNQSDLGYGYYRNYHTYDKYSGFVLAPELCETLLARLAAAGRLMMRQNDEDESPVPLAWDDGPAWRFRMKVARSSDAKSWQFFGVLERAGEIVDLAAPLLLLASGVAIFSDRVARFDPEGNFAWVAELRKGVLSVPIKQETELMERLAQWPCPVEIELPAELQWEEERPAPRSCLTIVKPRSKWLDDLECRLSFQYGDREAAWGEGPTAWFDRAARRSIRRDPQAEAAARERLLAAGAKWVVGWDDHRRGVFFVKPAKVPQLVRQLAAEGWEVEAEGLKIRRPGALQMSVTSGVDWFELDGSCDFDGVPVAVPKLLEALRRGEQFVALGDGTQGMLPEEWLARLAPLVTLGEVEKDKIRFRTSQATLLDALLAAADEGHVAVDEAFDQLRRRLHSFEGVAPRREPPSFQGELREYQREGLGWLHFLDEFAFGGCLADDMGLGKTIQILALLEERRGQRQPASNGRARKSASAVGPALVVVPRSLVFNWIEEARRFTPQMRVLNYTGQERRTLVERFGEADLVVTTYGTLRRDIAQLRETEFDYAILDEAQAIKNASSQAAKACRLLRARRRLAMTGTPVENHLGELWSLFEFLNPGMLGRSARLGELVGAGPRRGRPTTSENGASARPAVSDLSVLARALRPFLLRRTKQQVLAELPDKTEQTLYCELEGRERKAYDELREHYRRTLLARVSKQGVNKSKIHVLEALLRLRQAACHPGLLDKKKASGGSAKLETLLEQLEEVISEGHKALVFSQFTSLLAIVRAELDRRGIVYEYLDGRTVKRQAKVERFQNDPECLAFLISLKAGGQGLNLTAADYVFILDPWWNPAAEAQAVDRAHRIGQSRHVFAYRLIARDTVEEKILQLQEQKRGLAEAIVSADNSVLRNLTVEDLQLLLG